MVPLSSELTEAQAMVRLLDQMYDPARPYRLALGGSALTHDDALDRTGVSIPEVRLFGKMEPFEAWLLTHVTQQAVARSCPV